MAYREKENPKLHLVFEATIIPHSVDGKHSVEIVLTDSRWPAEMKVPRPSLTVELERPFDPITGETDRKLKAVFGKSVLNFAALGVVASMVHQQKKADEKAAPEPEKPLLALGEDGKPLTFPDIITALQKAGITLPPGNLKKDNPS